ncbi:MAG: ABC transporter permease [Gemmataceae bacterium]|nr:ABC transporter permease [Gemmataceae bacterium]
MDNRRVLSDVPFWACLALLGAIYLVLIVAMLWAQASFTTPGHLWSALSSPEIRYSVQLSLLSCSLTTILSLWVAVPLGYLLARWDDGNIRRTLDKLATPIDRLSARWYLRPLRVCSALVRLLNPKTWIDALLDIPIMLPPLVIGLALLILMQTPLGRWFENNVMGVTFTVPSIILAQFMVACAFAVRTMRVAFEQIPPREEAVALTLGCSRAQAFWMVVLPEARRGILTAATLAWARSLGEFGPILVFSGATRMRTEVLPTTVYLELSIGNIEAAVAVSLLMVFAAVTVLIVLRHYGSDSSFGKALAR